MKHNLKFHIDSSSAFAQFEKQQKIKDYDIKDDEFEITDQKQINKIKAINLNKHKYISEAINVDDLISMTAAQAKKQEEGDQQGQ